VKVKRTHLAAMEAASLLGKSRNFGIPQHDIAYSRTTREPSKKVLLLKNNTFALLKI
jgi:hypothetical protein